MGGFPAVKRLSAGPEPSFFPAISIPKNILRVFHVRNLPGFSPHFSRMPQVRLPKPSACTPSGSVKFPDECFR
jgi:hypothetical protein